MDDWLPNGDKWWLGVYLGIGLMVLMVLAPRLSWNERPVPEITLDREVTTDSNQICADRMGIDSRGRCVCS